MIPLGQADPPAGGAETSEVIIATAGAGVVTLLLLAPIVAYKLGRFPALGRLAEFSGRLTGLPGWAALPGTFLAGTLLIAVFGMYWDISLHIDDGRDPGPLANPAHYFILAGLFGVLLAGVLGAALSEKPTRTSLEVLPGWHAPVGALMILVCGASSLLAFPLDDIWHRLFGQDVTLWGPTHLMLIGGAALSVLGAWALHVEGDEVRRARGGEETRWARMREVALCGAFLIAVSTFQAEYDFSVPQFSLLLQPILIMLAAGVALVAARIRFGPGGALVSLVLFLIVRGILALSVGEAFGQTVPTFPLYVAEAICVEAVALLWLRGESAAARPISFGVVAGLAIGTVGLAGEWAWLQVWSTNPWTGAMLPEAAVLGLIAALAGGVLGGFIGRSLTPGVERSERVPGLAVPAAAVLAVGVLAFTIPVNAGDPVRASFDLTEAVEDGGRTVTGTVRLDPPEAADDAYWLNITAWQGGERSQINQLEGAGPATYRIDDPVPVDGTWKSTLRLHDGRRIAGLPIFLPRDEAIPAEETPVPLRGSREFVLDKENLQREQKDDVPAWLTLAAYLGVGAISLFLIGLMGWGLRRLESHSPGPRGPSAEPAGVGPGRRLDEGSRPRPAPA